MMNEQRDRRTNKQT